jgi:hypothetical protein
VRPWCQVGRAEGRRTKGFVSDCVGGVPVFVDGGGGRRGRGILVVVVVVVVVLGFMRLWLARVARIGASLVAL